jgi:hypothetical protein
MKNFLLTAACAATLCAVALPGQAGTATTDTMIAKRGADDGAGHQRRGRGSDDGANHARRGADDGAGHQRRGRGSDDGAGHA